MRSDVLEFSGVRPVIESLIKRGVEVRRFLSIKYMSFTVRANARGCFRIFRSCERTADFPRPNHRTN